MNDATNTSALVVSDLHKRFGSEEVLKGVTLDAREGDVISLLGASGSGKSTFLAGFLRWGGCPSGISA